MFPPAPPPAITPPAAALPDLPPSLAMARPRPALSVVVPCYNEEATLPLLHARVSAAARAAVGDDHEIVLVNDGSRDGSWTAMQRLAAADPRVVAINLSRNHGHQLALTAGLDLCAGEQILIIDADLPFSMSQPRPLCVSRW